jgi:hypothetical protein
VIRRAANLYPADWRERYGDEFDALLEDQSASPGVLADVVAGAVDAHLAGARGGFGMREWLRRPAMLGIVIGSLAWLAALGMAQLGGTFLDSYLFDIIWGARFLVVASALWLAASGALERGGMLDALILVCAVCLVATYLPMAYPVLVGFGLIGPIRVDIAAWNALSTAFYVAQAVFAVTAIVRGGLSRPALGLVAAVSVALAIKMQVVIDDPVIALLAPALPLGWLLVGLSGLLSRKSGIQLAGA